MPGHLKLETWNPPKEIGGQALELFGSVRVLAPWREHAVDLSPKGWA
jgi:hypothetical protein